MDFQGQFVTFVLQNMLDWEVVLPECDVAILLTIPSRCRMSRSGMQAAVGTPNHAEGC